MHAPVCGFVLVLFHILHNRRLVSESMDVACLMGMRTVHIDVAECDDITNPERNRDLRSLLP